MKMKKAMTKIFGCALAASVLAGCSAGHTHASTEGWELNAKEHWQVCECGEALNTADHTLDEYSMCSVCGAEVWNYGDGADVYLYSAYGDPVRMTSYDADGNVTSDQRYECEYDADGNKLTETYHENGVLRGERTYEAGVLLQYIDYYEDGGKGIMEYDENGNLTHNVFYDADGAVTSETWSEYACNADGEWYETKNTMTDQDGAKYIGEFNEQGDQIAWRCYDADGNLEHDERYEFEYNNEGRKQVKRIYESGTLTEELIYVTVTDEYGWMSYPQTIIYYHADGSKTVEEYNENDELVSETVYDAAGNVVE